MRAGQQGVSERQVFGAALVVLLPVLVLHTPSVLGGTAQCDVIVASLDVEAQHAGIIDVDMDLILTPETVTAGLGSIPEH